jgi:hypothetical protein
MLPRSSWPGALTWRWHEPSPTATRRARLTAVRSPRRQLPRDRNGRHPGSGTPAGGSRVPNPPQTAGTEVRTRSGRMRMERPRPLVPRSHRSSVCVTSLMHTYRPLRKPTRHTRNRRCVSQQDIVQGPVPGREAGLVGPVARHRRRGGPWASDPRASRWPRPTGRTRHAADGAMLMKDAPIRVDRRKDVIDGRRDLRHHPSGWHLHVRCR